VKATVGEIFDGDDANDAARMAAAVVNFILFEE
jgi:hypothetical protein